MYQNGDREKESVDNPYMPGILLSEPGARGIDGESTSSTLLTSLDAAITDDEEADDDDAIKQFTKSGTAQFLVSIVIVVNTVVMAIEVDNPDWEIWPPIENALLIFFVTELACRLYTYRWDFFLSEKEWVWNVFDFIVVVVGVLDQWVLKLLNSEHGERGKMMSIVRVLRVVRILRILRLLRLFKMFKELYLLAVGLVVSIRAVWWTTFLFMIIIIIAAIFCTTLIGHEAQTFEDPVFIYEYFGTVINSCNTLFQFVTLDDWSYVAQHVTPKMPWMHVFFVIYILVTAFTILSLLTGVVTENILRITGSDEEKMALEQETKVSEFQEDVRGLFAEADLDKNQKVSRDEFEQLIRRKDVRKRLMHDEIEVNHTDLVDLFACLDVDNMGWLSQKAFEEGLSRIAGSARAKDVCKLRADVARMDHRMSRGTAEQYNSIFSDDSVQLRRFCHKANEVSQSLKDTTNTIERIEDETADFMELMGRPRMDKSKENK